MLIDSHCHINLPELASRLDDVLANMHKQLIDYALVVSVDKNSFNEIEKLINSHPNLFGSIGIHPDGIDNAEFSLAELIENSKQKKIVALGETGLDYHWNKGDLTWQHQRFIKHIEASKETSLPLIIHTRDAKEVTLDIMQSHQASKAVIHCFTEDKKFARRALDLGYFISFSGIVSFKNAKEIQEVCQFVPDDRLLIETDSPYLAPVPMRGKVNEPSFIIHTAKFVAQLRQQPLEKIAEITTCNFFSLFDKAKLYLDSENHESK